MSTTESFDYTDFCTPAEIRTFKRVKLRQMRLADACRNVLCDLTNGDIGDGRRSNKQFLVTRHGKFRVAISPNSDNSTEFAAHERMGVSVVYAGDKWSVLPFLKSHGVLMTWASFRREVHRELQRMANGSS